MLILLPLLIALIPPRHSAPRPDVHIIGLDYAFTVPSELPPARTTFRFDNRGKQRHELNIVLLRPGVSIQSFIADANASRPLTPSIEAPVGVLFAEPGGSSPSALTTDLRPGRTYAIICIFRDSAGKPRHHELGMYSAIHVANVPAAKEAPERVDSIVAMDYAFHIPTRLAAGVHHFAFVNKGKQRHEVSLALLKKGVTLQKIVELDKVDGDIEPFLEQGLGVLHAQPGTTPVGLLRIDLLAGRTYLLECGFSDTDKSPPHYKLGMYGTITAR